MKGPPPSDVVLVVDDSPETVRLLTDVLDAEGMTVTVALDGEAAVRVAGRLRPDVVLMDARMPVMDGFECCRRLKAVPGFGDVPVIFMTGLAEPGDVIRGFGAGAADYVTKPIDVDSMLARIRLHLANARKLQSARGALDVADQFLLATDRYGAISWFTPRACRLLERLVTPGEAELRLPGQIAAKIRAIPDDRRPSRVPSGNHAFASGDETIRMSFIGWSASGELLFRLTDISSGERVAILASQYSLTFREAEVLSWTVRGKSNRDIAVLLALSHRTVDKHLQSVFAKMGVENRTAAAAMVANL